MYNLTDISTIKKLLNEGKTNFDKSLGQNFIIDSDVCPEMADLCGVTENDGVLEIGPGIGVLTVELCKRAKKVVALEIDKSLIPLLGKTLAEFDNVKVINDDILKTNLKKLISEEFPDMKVYVCANLPYYITSPVIMKLLEETEVEFSGITVMVQKEAAERLCAPAGTRESGAISIAAEILAKREELFDVPRECFMPSPKVDSRVIKLTPGKGRYDIKNKKLFMSIIKAGFGKRRKTLVNAITSDLPFSKEDVKSALEASNLDLNTRIEQMSMEQLMCFCNNLENN